MPEEGEARLLVAARVGTTRLIDNVGVLLGDMREREIAQAALSAAGLDDQPLTEEEMAELKKLKARVDEVRAEREAREARDGLRGAGFAAGSGAGTAGSAGSAGGMDSRVDGVDGDTVRRPVSEGGSAGTTDSTSATDSDSATEGGR